MEITDDFSFNVAKGKVAAYAEDIPGEIIAVVLEDDGVAGDVTDAVRDADSLAAVLAVAPEASSLGRVVLQNLTVTVDDTSNSVAVDCDDWSYPNATAGTDTMAIVVAHRPASGSLDSSIVPLLGFIYSETTTGSTLNILVPEGGFFTSEDAA